MKSLVVASKSGKAPRIQSRHWVIPGYGEIKVWRDGASIGSPGNAGCGAIFRDNNAYVVDIRTFEILLRTYEVREGKMESSGNDDDDEAFLGSLPCKRRQRTNEGSNVREKCSAPAIMARPCAESRGHTGYLTFARLKCLQ
ncbi:hypothetical protein GIB67_017698 [Kingdonia uniflora]|uniref:tRNA (adenine(58)-N(1))-methyltransferase catalytic subunit TRM61 C-terminal domain-containing protein n=1 Tax=Kingdonia uniflora TaxID=39325 RepID=A0A7J7NAP2_9MAGN|nr:hypothetical protein GIB67_017698 [Kingdonia uniflora]